MRQASASLALARTPIQLRLAKPGTIVEIPETLDWSPETLPGVSAGVGLVVVGAAGASVGIVGIVAIAAGDVVVFTKGDAVGDGIDAKELTPRLAISQEPSGIPTLGLPPGVVEVVDGVDGDIGGPLDPSPHIPDTPTVPMARVVAVAGIPIGVLLDVAELLVMAAMPVVVAVALAVDPIAIPPPS